MSLEEDFGWTGLLIEASPSYFEKLAARRRNAWTANVCLSGEIEKVNKNRGTEPGIGFKIEFWISERFQNKHGQIRGLDAGHGNN